MLLKNVLLHPKGIIKSQNGVLSLHLYFACLTFLRKSHTPKFALANDLYLGQIPDALKDLTHIKQTIISLNRC